MHNKSKQNNVISTPIKQKKMKRKYFCTAAQAHSSEWCANVPGSSLFVHKDETAYSKNPRRMHECHG